MKSRHQILNAIPSIPITTYIWLTDSERGYINVNAHFIDNGKICSVLATNVMFGSHIGENVGNVLTNVLTEWSILEKIVTIVSDNGANIKKLLMITHRNIIILVGLLPIFKKFLKNIGL